MTDEKDLSADERAALEISLPTAMELCRLGLATMIDIRQSFEIEMKGAIPDTVHIPMFEVKLMLGHTLTEDEQDILDAGEPKELDAQRFFRLINQLHPQPLHMLPHRANAAEIVAETNVVVVAMTDEIKRQKRQKNLKNWFSTSTASHASSKVVADSDLRLLWS